MNEGTSLVTSGCRLAETLVRLVSSLVVCGCVRQSIVLVYHTTQS